MSQKTKNTTNAPGPETGAEAMPPAKKHRKRSRVARDLSFGMQQTIVCWITDVVTDPLFSMLSQNNKHLKKIFGDESEKDTTWLEQVKSEVTGDLLAFFSFVPLRALFRKPFDSLAQWVEKKMDAKFEKLGHGALKEWADHHKLTRDDPRYQHRLKEFKERRAHNVVDSSLIGVLSLGFNTFSQKVIFKSDKPWGLVAVAKTIGMLITVVATLGFKTYMPKTSRKTDNFLEGKVFSKLTGAVGIDGLDDTDLNRPPEAIENAAAQKISYEKKPQSHAATVGTREQREAREQNAAVPSY